MIENGNIKDLNRYYELISIPELKLANGDYLSIDELKNYITDNYFLVYKKNDKILGLVFGEKIKNNGVMLWMIVVEKKYRGNGIGKKLILEFENRLKKKNEHIEWIILYSYNKEKVVKFYKNIGYKGNLKFIELQKNFD